MLCLQGPPRSDCNAMRSDSMQLQYEKRFKMYYFYYLSAVFCNKYFVCKRYFGSQAGYLLGKAVLCRLDTGNFSNR